MNCKYIKARRTKSSTDEIKNERASRRGEKSPEQCRQKEERERDNGGYRLQRLFSRVCIYKLYTCILLDRGIRERASIMLLSDVSVDDYRGRKPINILPEILRDIRFFIISLSKYATILSGEYSNAAY